MQSNKTTQQKLPLSGDLYFTQQTSPNSSLFDLSDISVVHKSHEQAVNSSFVSSHSLSEQLWLRSILKEWRKYTKQVKRDKQIFFSVRDFVIRRLTKKAYNSLKMHYARSMLVKHLNLLKGQKIVARDFNTWRSKFISRLRSRMFFIKYLEYRSSKLQGLTAFKQNIVDSQKITKISHLRTYNVQKEVYLALMQNVENKRQKREKAFKVYFFNERWSILKGWSLLVRNVVLAREMTQSAGKFRSFHLHKKVI